jgi:hypothetical protein
MVYTMFDNLVVVSLNIVCVNIGKRDSTIDSVVMTSCHGNLA